MNIVNIFDNVWQEEKNIKINTELLPKISIKYCLKSLSNINIPFIYSFPNSFCDHKTRMIKCKKCNNLLKKIISNTNIVYVNIGINNYISNDYIFPLYTNENNFTLFEFLIQLKKKWEKIYEEDTKKTFGIWGHDLSDLSVYNIQIFAYTLDNIPLIKFSTDS